MSDIVTSNEKTQIEKLDESIQELDTELTDYINKVDKKLVN